MNDEPNAIDPKVIQQGNDVRGMRLQIITKRRIGWLVRESASYVIRGDAATMFTNGQDKLAVEK